MKIAITSGKGGVGKTFVSTCLAQAFGKTQDVTYIDCDVEAPNAHLFLQPEHTNAQEQMLECVEGVDPAKCNYCGLCAKNCFFNAIVVGKKNAMVFPELCRWCGACQIVCPQDALVTGQRSIGTIYNGKIGNINLNWATLQTGAGGMTVKLIERIKQEIKNDLAVLDSPPGTSCAVVNTINDADVVVLVSDPTRFGQHDLKLSVHLCKQMGIMPVVIINRAGIGDKGQLTAWCKAEGIEVIAEIPDDRTIAELYSKGLLPTEHLEHIERLFADIAARLLKVSTNREIAVPTAGSNSNLFLDSDRSFNNTVTEQTPTAVNEITIVSGKGGTGKTSLSACFAQLQQTVITDCDVDAADVHLLLEPEILESDQYQGGRVMSIDPDKCVGCQQCVDVCQWQAISIQDNGVGIDPDRCEGCGSCKLICGVDAIDETKSNDGRWYFSSTRFGKMSHATLEPGKENSGKLVTLLRKNTSEKIIANDNPTVVLDGSPGTGCPVIASIGGAKAAIIVTEPTTSGLHDLKRILELTNHFKITSGVVINKCDLNPDVTNQIKDCAKDLKASILGQLPYDSVFIDAQQESKTVLEFAPESKVSKEIKSIWNNAGMMATNNTGTTNE